MGQLGGEVQPFWEVSGQRDRRDRNRGRARLGGSVLSRTMGGKVVGERLTVTGLGAVVGGRRVLVLAVAQALPLQHHLLSRPGSGGGRVAPDLGLGRGCELSRPPAPFPLAREGDSSEKRVEERGRRAGDKARATTPLCPPSYLTSIGGAEGAPLWPARNL